MYQAAYSVAIKFGLIFHNKILARKQWDETPATAARADCMASVGLATKALKLVVA